MFDSVEVVMPDVLVLMKAFFFENPRSAILFSSLVLIGLPR